eukprot:scaffold314630_cov32-Tisochrysis_lutea.AAC.2
MGFGIDGRQGGLPRSRVAMGSQLASPRPGDKSHRGHPRVQVDGLPKFRVLRQWPVVNEPPPWMLGRDSGCTQGAAVDEEGRKGRVDQHVSPRVHDAESHGVSDLRRVNATVSEWVC